MMRVVVNGNNYETLTMNADDIRPGSFVRWKESRRAFRIVCLDGDDVILRNLRKRDLLEATPKRTMMQECWLLTPAGGRS